MIPRPAKEKPLARLNRLLRVALTPLQIVGNFVFLSIAWCLGVGFSALLYRLGPGRRKVRDRLEAPEAPDSYWRRVPPAPAPREAWHRPF